MADQTATAARRGVIADALARFFGHSEVITSQRELYEQMADAILEACSMPDREPTTTARDVSSLARFGVTAHGGLRCLACTFTGSSGEVSVPSGYRGLLAWLVKIADLHNREVHPDG